MTEKRTDPVTSYAQNVVNGRIVAGRLVRMACQRHLSDQQQAKAKGLVWKPDEATRVIEFFPAVLRLPENTSAEEAEDGANDQPERPFVLSPFQEFIAGSLFGWYTTSGYRRFRIGYVETAKGSGKTPFGAGLMLYLLVADGERGAQVYAAAVTKDQAKLAFTDAERMVEASPALTELVDRKVNNLAVLETGSFFRPISSEKRGLDGKRVHGALIDELHEHREPIVYLKMRAGTKGRRNALILEITNSGFDTETVCWDHHDYSRQVLEGSVTNEAWFAYVCHLDACEACYAAGKVQPADDCPNCDDWKTEGPHWLKANPNLGVSLPWEYLREQVREAMGLPSQRNMVRRLNFCQWTQQATVWIPLEKWAACEQRFDLATFVGRECFVGIDMSEKLDLTSVVLVFPRPLGPVDPMAQSALHRGVDVIPFFWLPKATLHRRANEDKIPYPDWERDGYLRVTLGSTIDPDAIAAFLIDEVSKKYRIRGIGFDQAGAVAVINRLEQHFGKDLVTEIPQGFRHLSAPAKLLEALVVSGLLQHDGNKCQSWCISNMAIEENAWREIRPIKIHQRKRIDGGVALIDALAMMERTPDRVRSKYEQGGLVTA